MRIGVVRLAIGILGAWLLGPEVGQAGTSLDRALGAHCGRTTCVIKNNPGGDVDLFQQAAHEVVWERKRLVIDGLCASACVILADMARRNTCITSRARIAVHKASIVQMVRTTVANRKVTVGKVVGREDPPQSNDINRWVKAHGGYPTEGMRVIPVKDAQQFWPMCS